MFYNFQEDNLKISCDVCSARVSKANVARHKQGNQCKTLRCKICDIEVPFIDRKNHKKTHDQLRNDENPAVSSTLPDLPPFEIDESYVEIYTTFSKFIESYIRKRTFSTVYNFQIKNFAPEEIVNHARQIFNCQVNTFKISISFGYILRNTDTEELAFYWSSQNNQLLFDSPRLIRNQHDIEMFIESIKNVDLKRHAVYPNTKYTFVKATNVTFYVTHQHGIAIGAPTELPEFLLRNKGIISLIKSNKTGKPYNDKRCFFRSLALFRGAQLRALEKEAKGLLKQYCDNMSIEVSDFDGISLDQLEDASKIFDIGVNVYTQAEDRSTNLIFRTLKQDNILYLNLFDEHFSFIKNFDLYSSSYCCPKCRKIFPRHYEFKRHLNSCDAATKQVYSNGVFKLPQTIFEDLQLYGINIPSELRFYEYRICFDIECMMMRDTKIQDTAKVAYAYRHELVSISICSNVPEFTEARCFVSDGCPRELVKKSVRYMIDIAEEAASLQRQKFVEFIPQIGALGAVGIQNKFDEYIGQIPVLSFNGAKYDLKVLKDYLIPILVELEDMRYVIKRGSAYSCIATGNFKFLDITSYLAAGINYDSFLKAYHANLSKSFFPYEYFDSLDKLASTDFPQYEDFFSLLKGKNTLEPSKSETLSVNETYIIGRVPTKDSPLTDSEIREIAAGRYGELHQQFLENGWTFRDFLIYYNNRLVKQLENVYCMTNFL